MLIKEVFAEDITRDIAPVVYFHEKDPQKVLAEVSEYIITGGYPETDQRFKKMQSGIHEQYVRLLTGMAAELKKPGGPELPASWISGFYGSGKSSFAKLLGLALDGLVLPDGRNLADALIARDDSPRAGEFREAWDALIARLDPLAAVFDIGTVARENETIHSAVKRYVQTRLGYCAVNRHVADYELKLELDGKWDEFLALAEPALGKPWDAARNERLAADYFSKALHAMAPELYTDPMSWIDSRSGDRSGAGTSVEETVQALSDMLDIRAAGKTLFVIIDEVSQYIHQNERRMLQLQSFVSDLGQRLKGRVWLIATGQQKLEDTEDRTVLGKLKDRFPSRLRAHLSNTNIRDVVHKRLLKKNSAGEDRLRQLFQENRSDLKLYAYACSEITEEDFVEVYPLLPGHVDLLMRITSSLRLRSSRVKGDDYAIRGLLQLLGELFREVRFGEKPLGALITLDHVFDIQHTALDADIQNTLNRIFTHKELSEDQYAVKAAKAVALLELIQEQTPTTAELIAQCLYSQVGMGAREPEVRQALEKLCQSGLLAYSEKHGYKIQSAAGEEWQRDRDAIGVTQEEVGAIVAEQLKELMGRVGRPTYMKKQFPWAAYFNHGNFLQDERLHAPADLTVVTVDFRYVTNRQGLEKENWVLESDAPQLKDRLVWVGGGLSMLDAVAKELARSRAMIRRHSSGPRTLSQDKRRLFYEEESRCEDLNKSTEKAVADAYVNGDIYFRGRALDKDRFGRQFATLLLKTAESVLPELYSLYIDIAVTPTELNQLLESTLSGPSQKFMQTGLGVLDLDAGKYTPSCSGEVPSRIMQYIRDNGGVSGTILLNQFGKPPYGYAADVIKACLAGLLRAGKIRIRPDAGPEITSVRDPGARDMFQKERELKRADILPPATQGVTARDRIAICKLFSSALNIDPDRENDAIADAVFELFPGQMHRIQELEGKFNRLPEKPELPPKISKLKKALEDCKRYRHVEPTVQEVKKNIDVLRDGMTELNIMLSELNDDRLNALGRAINILDRQASQLSEINALGGIEESVKRIQNHLNLARPWRDISALEPDIMHIVRQYEEVRRGLIERQTEMAREIRERIKQRSGFEKLTPDQSHKTLRPVTKALYETTPEAVRPSLQQLRDAAPTRLKEAEEEADALLDDILSEVEAKQVIPFRHNLTGREIGSPADVEALLNELRERLLAQLKGNVRIRLT